MVDEDILLTHGAVYKKINKGDFIFQEGAICNFYYQLVEGMVSWQNFDDNGKVFIQSIVEKGESFGVLPLFDNLPYAASAVAETDSLVLRLPKQSFNQLLKDNSEVLFSFTQLLAKIIRDKFFFLKEIACENPEHKVLAVLNYFKHKTNCIKTESYKILLTRQQIAEMTGLRVETVIRVIKKLSIKGVLNITKGKIYLLNNDFKKNIILQ